MLELSPELAAEQIAIDQATRPGDLTLWLARARVLEAQGKYQESEEAFAHLIAMSDGPIVHGEYARILTRRGASLEKVRKHLALADAESGRRTSPRSDYLVARGTLYSKRQNLGAVANRLANLWNRRDEYRAEVPPLELGRVYATTLFQLSSQNSLRRLESVTEDMARYTEQDPYGADMVQAFTSLVRTSNSLRGEELEQEPTSPEEAGTGPLETNNESIRTEVPLPDVALPGEGQDGNPVPKNTVPE